MLCPNKVCEVSLISLSSLTKINLDILPPSQRNEGKLISGVIGTLPSLEIHKNLEHLPDAV